MNTPHSIIEKSDDRLFPYYLNESAQGLLGMGSKEEKERRKEMLIFSLLGLILIVGTEPFKVLLRKNIGKLSLSLERLVIAAVLYWVFAAIFFYLPHEFPRYTSAFYAGGSFYTLFGILILALGVPEHENASLKYKINPDDDSTHLDRGDSIFFAPKNDAAQKQIWLIFEPLICFVTGVLFTVLPAFIHPILFLIGAPVLMTAISFWFNEVFQIKNVWNVQEKKVWNEKQKALQKEFYSREGFSPVTLN